MSCFQLLLEERYQRVAFELPDWFNVDDYASFTISAKVGTQLLVDFWGTILERGKAGGKRLWGNRVSVSFCKLWDE